MLRILVVDDHDTVRRSLRKLFEREGYTVVEASNGRMALTQMQNDSFDLVITDVFMPDMNGYQFLLTIRDSHASTPIMMMSGGGGSMGKATVLKAGAKLGAHRVFEKPFDVEEILSAVRDLVPKTEEGPSEEGPS